MKLRPATIYLDEAGHVYLPLLGPASSCLRLNQFASRLWRRWISEPINADGLPAAERTFLEDLLGKGALIEARDEKGAS